MKRYAKSLLTLFVLTALAVPPCLAQHDVGEEMSYCTVSTSLLITGGSSQSPYDEGSLNALFTSSFKSELLTNLDELVDEKSKNNFLVEMVHVAEISHADPNRANYGRVILLEAALDGVEGDLLAEVQAKAGPILVEMFTDRLNRVWQAEAQRQTRDTQLKIAKLGDRISELRDLLTIKQKEFSLSMLETIEDADSLRTNYLQLKNQQRDSRLERLQLQARREAIEKQLQMLEEKSQTLGDEPTLTLNQLQERLESTQARLKEFNERMPTIREREVAIAEKLQEMEARAKQLIEAGEDDTEIREQLEMIKEHVQRDFDQAKAEKTILERDVETTRLAYLQELDRLKQQKYGDRLAELNKMLTTVLIDVDQLNGQEAPLAEEVERAKQAYAQRLDAELGQKQLKLDIDLLEREFYRANEELQRAQAQQDAAALPELRIIPWGG